jgi:hydrogenase/urease accessory protein HupE
MILRILFALFIAAGVLQAHDPGLSSATITIGSDEVAVQLLLAPADLEGLRDSSPETVAKTGIELKSAAGETLPARTFEKAVAGEDAEIQLRYPRLDGAHLLYRAPIIAQLPFGHRQVLTVRDTSGALLSSRLLGAQDQHVEIPLTPAEAPGDAPPPAAQISTSGFLLLGIEHILTGYDHLLFLFALLLVCDGFWAAAKIITGFTVAHSLTLALATFNLVQLSASVVEPLIAASIIYVAVENVFFRPRLRWRSVLTFAFGLIHGLGFAGILRDLGLGVNGTPVAGPLFSFNLGVELGQLAIAALVLPLFLWLRRKPAFVARGVPALSLLIGAAGVYWLIERTLF